MLYLQLNQQLQYLLEQFNLNRQQGGCSLCIYKDGKIISKLASGTARLDRQTGKKLIWQTDTLSVNFSTGKGVLMTLIHVLVSQGLLAYEKPIANYWLAFAQNGKKHITLHDILTHEAGLFDITQVTNHAKDMLDWSMMLKNIEKMPISEHKQLADQQGDEFVAYSALISGWILGGLIEKVTNLSLQQALDNYLTKPLNIQGQIYFGLPSEKLSEVALPIREKEERNKPTLVEDSEETLAFYQQVIPYKTWQTLAEQQGIQNQFLTTQQINRLYLNIDKIDYAMYKSALVPKGSRQFSYYQTASLQAKIPGANAVATSLALATMYAMLANNGHWQGQTLIRPEVLNKATIIYNQVFDKIMPAVMRWRRGYHQLFSVCCDTKSAYGHMGYNGSVAWCDPSRNLAVAFVHNYDVTMLNDIRQFILNETILTFFDTTSDSNEGLKICQQ